MKTTITWYQPDERSMGREYSAWYIHQSTHDLVATVSNGKESIHIYADGEMRIIVNSDRSVIRYCDQFQGHGLGNDDEINHALDNDIIEYDNNPWFDLYTDNREIGDDGHLDCVCDTLTDAIDQAIVLLNQGLDQLK